MSGRILIVDPDIESRMALRAGLMDGFFDVDILPDVHAPDALTRAAKSDMVLLRGDFGSAGAATAFCRSLKMSSRTNHIPVLMLARDSRSAAAAFDAGADDAMTNPRNQGELLARVRGLIRMKLGREDLFLGDSPVGDLRNAQGGDDTAADDTPNDGREIILVDLGDDKSGSWDPSVVHAVDFSVIHVTDEASAQLALAEGGAAAVLLRASGTGSLHRALRYVARLRTAVETRNMPAILIIDNNDVPTAGLGLDLGASDFVTTDVSSEELIARIHAQLARQRKSDQLRASLRSGLELALIDPLTRLHNRRYATVHAPKLMERSHTMGQPFAVMMLDLDNFKAINDTHGHPVGDRVLEEVSSRVLGTIRGTDLVARYGGEEFLIAMPDADEAAAARVGERIRAAVCGAPVVSPSSGVHVPVTVSIGVAVCRPSDGEMFTDLVSRADKALYRSKLEGRNCVRMFYHAA